MAQYSTKPSLIYSEVCFIHTWIVFAFFYLLLPILGMVLTEYAMSIYPRLSDHNILENYALNYTNLPIAGIVRDRPVPIPGSGMQLTNISHTRDLSSMLTLAVEKPDAASANIFNCVSDRAVTLDGMAKLCAQAAGRPVNIIHYDPKAVGIDAKKAFPFRNMVINLSFFLPVNGLEDSL